MSIVTGCEEKVAPYEQLTDDKTGAQVYIAKAVDGMHDLTVFPYVDERVFTFGVSFGALGLPGTEIAVKLTEDVEAFDSLNIVRELNGLEPYERFPVEAYNIDKMDVRIPKGEVSSELISVTYYPEAFESDKDYLLPLSIIDASDYALLPSGKTLFLIAPKLEARPANTKGWVASASSAQDNGQENTGLASALLDGDLNTIWHSRYNPALDPFPHVIDIDMLSLTYVTKVALAPRTDNPNGPTRFKLEGSIDGTSWDDLTGEQSFNPANSNYQEYPIEPQDLRYLRLTILDGMQASGIAFLAEFVVYSY